jgi:hypothetical protein
VCCDGSFEFGAGCPCTLPDWVGVENLECECEVLRMIKVEHIETWGFEHAVRGMRNPMNSWDRSDSGRCYGCEDGNVIECCDCLRNGKEHVSECGLTGTNTFLIGRKDIELMKRLVKGGQPHRKFLRQIFVSMDITAPLYWWKEFDTYKVGTVANSCSTMHKIHDKAFDIDDFSHEHLQASSKKMLLELIEMLNVWREMYNVRHDDEHKKYWWQMIQLLPTSYNQKRTVTFNYENALNMIEYRDGHKLDEWCEFVEVLRGLPYMRGMI